jgi:lipopolysaccharide heptosyltransferase II
LFVIGNILGLGAWAVLPGYRRLALRNLEIAFGKENSTRQLRRLVRMSFQRLSANLLCSVKMGSMAPTNLAPHLETENFDVVHQILRKGTPVVLLLSHIGNWEIFAQLFPHYVDYTRLATVYQKLGNRHIDAHVRRRRGRAGVETFDRADGFHGPIQLLRSGGLIGILGDQHAGDHGVWTSFFGRLASTSPLPGLLAKRTGAAVIPAAVYTEGAARWRMVFQKPINSPGDSVHSITFKGNQAIEQQIQKAPEDWFWVHNRWKTPKPHFLLSHYKRGIYIPPEARALKPFRILIRGSNWLGDSIISMPAVRAIKAGRPDAHVTIAAPAKIAEVWKLVPDVDEIIHLTTTSLFTSIRSIRSQPRFDVAILFPNSLRTALEVWLARVPRRAGYRGHERRWLLNQLITKPAVARAIEHQVHHYLHLANEFGGPTEPPPAKSSMPPAEQNGAPIKLGLCPGAEYGPAKRWLPERFAQVAAAVSTQRPVIWTLFGTGADVAHGAIIEAAVPNKCVNRIGQTTLAQLIAELRECALLLTNDTGTMHLATLLGIPVVALFGSTEPRLTGPLGNGNQVIRHQVECSPCFLRECPIDFRCMKSITVAEVSASILAQLRALP